MSPKVTPRTLFPVICAIGLSCGTTASVYADETDVAKSVTQSVTGAFETIVIDATTAASKATAAAKKALAPSQRKLAAKKDGPKTDKDAQDSDKTSNTSTSNTGAADKKSTSKGAANTTADSKDNGKAANPKAVPASPAEKAADGAAKPADKDAKPAETPKAPAVATEWPAQDIELAKARCTQLLKGINAVTVAEAPFRSGECGTPAPVRLVSVGKNPEVTLSPQPILTCDMVATLTKWMENDVQPLARKYLGSEIVRLNSMSDYSCRHAYGRIGNKLSEHGKANALDIRDFVTRKGQVANVLEDWGMNKRDVAKQIAAAKASAAKAEAVKLAAEKAQKDRAEQAAAVAAAAPAATNAPIPRQTIVEGLPKAREPSPMSLPASVTNSAATKDGFGIGPNNLGGPKDAKAEMGKRKKKGKEDVETATNLPGADEGVTAPQPTNATSRFLHEAHDAACRTFGTTLGPEANEDHRNHFHVDMAERKIKKICD